jgi:hypothetical protein
MSDTEEMMMDDGPDFPEMLASFFMDDEGNNVVNVLSEIKTQMEIQNRLLVKLVSVVSELKAAKEA